MRISFSASCRRNPLAYSSLGLKRLASPLVSRDLTLTEMLSLIQIEIKKKSEEKGPRDITPPKIEITSRELSFGGY